MTPATHAQKRLDSTFSSIEKQAIEPSEHNNVHRFSNNNKE